MKGKKSLLVLLVLIFLLAISVSIAGAADQTKEKNIKAGNSYDLYTGNCGIYFVAPEDGTMKLGREDTGRLPLKFFKDVCTVEFKNDNGNQVRSFDGVLISYFVLDRMLLDKWNDGDLAFYVRDGGWKRCNATLISGGTHGRLSCWTGTFDSFGLVDVSEKDDEEDDKKKVKKPSGDSVLAGQTIDLYSGICGVYATGLPTAGYVDMDRVGHHTYSTKFVKDICEFTYKDSKDNDLSTGHARVIGYVNLSNAQLEAWNDGELGFFVNYGHGWSEIDAMVVNENGKPRICATMSGPGMFGIVDTTVKEVEED